MCRVQVERGDLNTFRYAYGAEEPRRWSVLLHELADQCAELHVLMNNCCDDRALRDAARLAELLGVAPAGHPAAHRLLTGPAGMPVSHAGQPRRRNPSGCMAVASSSALSARSPPALSSGKVRRDGAGSGGAPGPASG